MRRNFAQILESGKVDYKKEYKKLYSLLFDKHPDNYGHAYSVYNIFNDLFASFYFHGTSLSLQEFDEEHGFHFPHPSKENLEIEDLILLMEYFYNMLVGYLSSQNISSYSSINTEFLMQHKLFFLYKEKDEYKPLISRIAKDRERIMTVDLKSNIEGNSNLKCIENYKIIEGGKILAEFDLIIFDQPSNKLLLTELKWFYKADGEAGHTAVDLKIQQAVKLRQNREQIARKYLLKIMEEAFSENRNQELPEVMSCIVSKNYSGSAFLDDRIPIFDQFLFLQEMEKNRYCLNDFFADVKSKRYLPGIADMGIQLTQVPIEYAGIKIWIPGYRNLAEATHNR